MTRYCTDAYTPDLSRWNQMNTSILARIVVITLMLQLLVMVNVAYHGITGNLFDGFYWRTSGWSLFPIPLNPNWFGGIVYPTFVPLSHIELPVYLFFVGHGIWVLWEIVGVVCLMYPESPFLQSMVKRGKSIMVTRIGRGRW